MAVTRNSELELIRQTCTISNYCDVFQDWFEQVQIVEGFSDFYGVYLFICGLEPEIREIFVDWHQYSCNTVEGVISLALKIDANGLRDSFSPFDPISSFYKQELEFDFRISLDEIMKDNEDFKKGKISEVGKDLVTVISQEDVNVQELSDDINSKGFETDNKIEVKSGNTYNAYKMFDEMPMNNIFKQDGKVEEYSEVCDFLLIEPKVLMGKMGDNIELLGIERCRSKYGVAHLKLRTVERQWVSLETQKVKKISDVYGIDNLKLGITLYSIHIRVELDLNKGSFSPLNLDIWKWPKRKKICQNVSTYIFQSGRGIAVLLKSDSGYFAYGWLDEEMMLFDAMSCKVSAYSSTVISGYGEHEKLYEPLKLFNWMWDKNVIYENPMVLGFSKIDDLKNVVGLFRQAPEPYESSISALISGLIDKGKLDDVEKILVENSRENNDRLNMVCGNLTIEDRYELGFNKEGKNTFSWAGNLMIVSRCCNSIVWAYKEMTSVQNKWLNAVAILRIYQFQRICDTAFDTWSQQLVYALVYFCEDIILRLYQDIVLMEVGVFEILPSNVIVNLIKVKNLEIDLCKFTSAKVVEELVAESNGLIIPIQIILDALNALQICHVLESVISRISKVDSKPSSYSSRSRCTPPKSKDYTATSGQQLTSTMTGKKVYKLSIDYLLVVKSAIGCGSYLTDMLYMDHWYEHHIDILQLRSPGFSHVLFGIIKLTFQIIIFAHMGNWSKTLEYYYLQVWSETSVEVSNCSRDVSENYHPSSSFSCSKSKTEMRQKKPQKGVTKSLQQTGCTYVLDMYWQALMYRKGRFQDDKEFEVVWCTGSWEFSILYSGFNTSITSQQISPHYFNQRLHGCLKVFQEGSINEFSMHLKESKHELLGFGINVRSTTIVDLIGSKSGGSGSKSFQRKSGRFTKKERGLEKQNQEETYHNWKPCALEWVMWQKQLESI